MLTAAVLFAASTIANAQLFVGGNLGLGSYSINKQEVTGGTQTITVNPIKTLDFTIAPRIGFGLNEKMAVGVDLCYEMNNYNYPDDYDGMNETAHKRSETAFGAGLFFRYYALQIGQFSLFAEASAGLKMGSGKEDYRIDNVTTTVDKPTTTEIFAGIVPGISYKMKNGSSTPISDFASSASSTALQNLKKAVTPTRTPTTILTWASTSTAVARCSR